jgi:hypothetical protein
LVDPPPTKGFSLKKSQRRRREPTLKKPLIVKKMANDWADFDKRSSCSTIWMIEVMLVYENRIPYS